MDSKEQSLLEGESDEIETDDESFRRNWIGK